MKYRAFLSATALIGASFSSITPAYASAPASNPPTQTDMQNVCDTLDTDGAGTDVQVVLTQGAIDYGALTFDLGTITDVESTRVADHNSASTPFGTKSFYSVAGRHGGSVNLFATIGYPGITYAGSFVDQNADRTETDVYHFTCQVQQWQVVGSHTVTVPGDGHYIVDPALIGTPQYNAQLQACNAYNDTHAKGVTQGFWGTSPQGNCVFEGSLDTTETVDDYGWVNSGTPVPETLSDGPFYVDTVLYASQVSEPGHSVTETNNAPYFAGDVVVCINPGKKGGTWTGQNGWTDMTQCNTTYFNTAPYISGANVFHSASLPL
jgi:hypothetical protein